VDWLLKNDAVFPGLVSQHMETCVHGNYIPNNTKNQTYHVPAALL
jgi:hypothetical protein